jgi:hypothetical protein
MDNQEDSFLTCSFCEAELELLGKDGAILITKCPGCGMTSDILSDSYLAAEPADQVEVYHIRGKAPASTPPPG